ncbi:MAG: aldo/keto reductase [Anaerolineales bacterium]|jgi:diketogulonate reductase-like aldo/keto reductase
MKFESLHNAQIPKIGFGTWSIGGRMSPDWSKDERSLRALRTALEVGYTHFDTAEMYASGHSEELLGQAVRESDVPREKLFITSKVNASHLHYNDVLRACKNSLHHLGMDYLDLYLIHWPSSSIPLEETFRALNQLVREGRVRNVGVSNFDVHLLKQARAESEAPIFTDQVPYSLADRSNVRNGVLEYCQENDILLTAYSPVKEGRLRGNSTVQSIADEHDATPYQIALAWLVSQPRVITIPMSFNPEHIAENFAAADIELAVDEIEQVTNLTK